MSKLYLSKGSFPTAYFEATTAYIAAVQEPDGSIPWTPKGTLDPWDHVESAMGLTVGNRFDEARRAYRWLKDRQLPNGSWYAGYKDGSVHDGTRAETNFVAYVATGVWHYYLCSEDLDFLSEMWTTVDRAIEFVLELQGSSGEVYWALDTTKGVRYDSLVTGCSSIYKSLECALNIAAVLKESRPNWQLGRTKLRNALINHPECFDRTWDSKSRFAMDWYYPVLTGVVTGAKASAHIAERWGTFVVDNLGCRCVSDEPWVTVAETCELTMALLAAGDRVRATQIYSTIHDHRDDDGAYWTGYVYSDAIIWPDEKTSWTAAAVLLAGDALAGKTPAATLFTKAALIEPVSSTGSDDLP